MRQLLSVEKYKRFRKYFNEVYSSLDSFYNQFAEVLLVRIKKQDISSIKNPRLAMFNLYSAAKAFCSFCYEYDLLFSEYSGLSTSFKQEEAENIQMLVYYFFPLSRGNMDLPQKPEDDFQRRCAS